MSLLRRIPVLVPLALAACAPNAPQMSEDSHMEIARQVLASTPLFDGHNDLPWAIRTNRAAPRDVAAYNIREAVAGHTDIPRLRSGMLGAQFWSIYVSTGAIEDGASKVQLEQFDIAHQIFATYPDVFAPVLRSDEVMPAFRSGRIASVLGMEGGHVLENSLGALRSFYDLGARYLTLTHSQNTDWADSATDEPEHDGLTPFGEEVVREMNRLGMLVDLSHVAPSTMHDALDVSEAPVIFSHSSARGVIDHPRNVPDDVLRRLSANGGVVMVNFVPGYINQTVATWESTGRNGAEPEATVEDVVRHLEHIREVAGIDHVGIGADYDGIDSTPTGLGDVSTYPVLFAELSRRGWSPSDLRKLAGENVLRAWSRAEEVSARLRSTRGPSVATIEQLDG